MKLQILSLIRRRKRKASAVAVTLIALLAFGFYQPLPVDAGQCYYLQLDQCVPMYGGARCMCQGNPEPPVYVYLNSCVNNPTCSQCGFGGGPSLRYLSVCTLASDMTCCQNNVCGPTQWLRGRMQPLLRIDHNHHNHDGPRYDNNRNRGL